MSEIGGEMELPQSELVGQPRLESNKDIGKPHCLFISGALGENRGIEGIKRSLEGEYGLGKVDAFNSILNLKDVSNPKRFEQMADVIQQHAKDGLDIVVHSLGVVELVRAIEIVKKRDEAFFDNKDNTKKLNIVLISPSGFNKGIVGVLRYLGRIYRFNREQGSWPVFSKADTLRRGIDALTAFPPDGISSVDLARALREAMPEISLDREEVKKISLDKEENYKPYLSEDQRKRISDYSNMIRSAIENRNPEGLRHLVKKYGEIFKKTLDEVYIGSFDSTDSNETSNLTKMKMIGGLIGSLRSLNNALGSVPMRELEALQEKGVDIKFIVPEYDTDLRIEQAIAFLEKSDRATIAGGMTHQFPGLIKPQFGGMVKGVLGDNAVK